MECGGRGGGGGGEKGSRIIYVRGMLVGLTEVTSYMLEDAQQPTDKC